MKYITGIHALNLNCSLETCGDWHQSAIQWERPFMLDIRDSIFGSYGIEGDVKIPGCDGLYFVANHIRALLDLLELGKFSIAQGMRGDFICNPLYTQEIFWQVAKLKSSPLWTQIDEFMKREYRGQWLDFKGREMAYECQK